MNTYEQTLTAGQVWVLDAPGELFRILDSSAAVDVQITRAGVPFKEAKALLAGFWAKPRGGFSGVRITNGGTAQTIKVGIAEGESGYDRLQIDGTLQVQQGQTVADPAAVAVGAAATLLVAASSLRKSVRFYNASTTTIYIGSSAVTTAGGAIRLEPGQTWIEDNGAAAAWYGIAGSAGHSVRIQTVT